MTHHHHFYGYTLRKTVELDYILAMAWFPESNYRFWINQPRRENFIVSEGDEPIAFFQIEHVKADQARIHFQSSPLVNPKKILRGITKLVPLIEKALALRGVRAIFFTSHSDSMAAFMDKRLGYQYAGWGGADGMMMAKNL